MINKYTAISDKLHIYVQRCVTLVFGQMVFFCYSKKMWRAARTLEKKYIYKYNLKHYSKTTGDYHGHRRENKIEKTQNRKDTKTKTCAVS